MTKEQVEKHSEVIIWWLDNADKGVFELTFIGWEITYSPEFYPADKYVKNDEYAEFRKALVDGKQIQYNAHCHPDISGVWKRDKLLDFHLPVANYRIKSDKPEFKIGDWIIYEDNSILQIDGFSIPYYKKEAFHSKGLVLPLENAKLWEPKEDEYCVFWDDSDRDVHYTIAIYDGAAENNVLYTTTADFGGFDNIAPLEFIETLKKK